MKKLKRAIIKEELVALLGDHIQALILDKFLEWYKNDAIFNSFIEEIPDEEIVLLKEMFEPGYLEKTRFRGEWICKSAKALKEELMINMSIQTIGNRIKDIVNRGYLERRKNPDFRKGIQTFEYRLNIPKIETDLQKLGYVIDYTDTFIEGIRLADNIDN